MNKSPSFVGVDPATGRFHLENKPYHFMGTNFWYGMPLGSPGQTGDRARLIRELDALDRLGVRNLRILAASEGPNTEPWRMVGALQTSPGEYDEQQLLGLDFLLAEMAKRHMKAIVVLGNMWQWSGGFAAYVAWVTQGEDIPYPGHSNDPEAWARFQAYSSRFFHLPAAKRLYCRHLETIVSRVNTLTGDSYTDDPTIMAWQLANEPRGELNDNAYYEWVKESSELLKKLDQNHLVSIGSEGVTPWTTTLDNRFEEVHQLPGIDYATFHIWVQNWNWYDPKKGNATLEKAIGDEVMPYIAHHVQVARKLRVPIVLEEFGISRAAGSCDPVAKTDIRDQYYGHIFNVVAEHVEQESPLCGVNFWAWSGEGRPASPGADWSTGDPYTGDPPHEPQGWYGVYDRDQTTHSVIEFHAKRINS